MSDSIITIGHYADGTPIRKRVPYHVADSTPAAKMAQRPPTHLQLLEEQRKCAELNRPKVFRTLLGKAQS